MGAAGRKIMKDHSDIAIEFDHVDYSVNGIARSSLTSIWQFVLMKF